MEELEGFQESGITTRKLLQRMNEETDESILLQEMEED